jgi:uncharacterized membrane protein
LFDLSGIFALNSLLAVLSMPFLWELVPRNRFYGFRVPATLSDDQVWYTMNRRVSREMIIAGFALAFCAAVADLAGLDTPVARALLSIATLTAIATMIAKGWLAANRLARQR